jgi:hypothetical protein
MTEVPEWDRVKDLLVAIDAQLRAFTDREVQYYLKEDFATVTVSVLAFVPKLERAALLQMPISRLVLGQPLWSAEHASKVFIEQWVERLKMARRYEELNVIFDSPPSWAVNALEEKENHIAPK